MRQMSLVRWTVLGCAGALVAACGDGNYAAEEEVGPRSGPAREYNERFDESLFGEGGLSLTRVLSGDAFDGEEGQAGSLPVNRFLWQASLDTLSFLPLSSTDPYTGVIATDWGAAPNQPGERFKVTAYMLSPALSASSLKVAVYREVRDGEQGVWVPATVSPDTPRKIEDAILTRARQIRIAEVEGNTTG
ncbi:MAG: DUF3576 domain-containing protein [Pseudomonadota bacterium]